jgi:hypothetical protein
MELYRKNVSCFSEFKVIRNSRKNGEQANLKQFFIPIGIIGEIQKERVLTIVNIIKPKAPGSGSPFFFFVKIYSNICAMVGRGSESVAFCNNIKGIIES